MYVNTDLPIPRSDAAFRMRWKPRRVRHSHRPSESFTIGDLDVRSMRLGAGENQRSFCRHSGYSRATGDELESVSPEMKRVLTIAGSDSSGGAGIQADLKTFVATGVYGMSVVTALTAQNTTGTFGIHPVPIEFIRDQFNAVATDIGFDAVKTGMLANQRVIREVAGLLASSKPAHLVVDPVMVATSGSKLLEDDACSVLKSELLPLATLLTPNMPEASALLGREVVTYEDAKEAAYDLQKVIQGSGGNGAVLVKGGHAENSDASVDILYDGKEFQAFSAPRLKTRSSHGTGCTLASACAAWLARGESIPSAVEKAKQYVYEAMSHAEPLGKGTGPLNHGYLLKS